ncbi:hypothetical protein M0534_09235 [Methylonatrum kenyense]|uniref:hypothetical protein n=1 Tax=Methylonatrum kenyense TaxID=455253 RepID=UPI0020BE5F2E|nr:hypothetical protein [Methylonatrum kenyense]MCK8516506.1 hypothetical protein [Methylonatrum kenyense]
MWHESTNEPPETGSSSQSPLAELIDGQTLALVPKSISGWVLFESGVSSKASLAFMMIYLKATIYQAGARGGVEQVREHMPAYFEISESEADALLDELVDAQLLLRREEGSEIIRELPPQAFQAS